MKLQINAHNFRHSGSNSIKVIFLDSSHPNLSNDVYFIFEEVRISPSFLVMILL